MVRIGDFAGALVNGELESLCLHRCSLLVGHIQLIVFLLVGGISYGLLVGKDDGVAGQVQLSFEQAFHPFARNEIGHIHIAIVAKGD